MQKGFINLQLYIMLGLGMIVLVLSISLKVQTSRLESEKAEFSAFRSEVKTAGIAAKKKAEAENKLNQERKDKADREYKKLLADNAALKRMRDSRVATSGVPQVPSGSSRPDLICFDREAFKRAYGELVTEIRAGADEGTESALALDSVKRWSQSQ